MTTVFIRYSELSDSAQWADSASKGLDEYVDNIPYAVTKRLSDLTDNDPCGYIGSAISLANQKADLLRTKAQEYKNYSSNMSNLVKNAQAADNNVSDKMDCLAHDYLGDSPWEQICYYLDKLYNDKIGSTELGAFIDNCINSYKDWRDSWIKKAYNWFVHGDGQYVLNITLSILGTIGAITAAILTFPVSGVFAAIMAGLSVFAAGVSAVNSVFTIADNCKTMSLNDTDPGLARYYGKTSNISDYAQKHTNDKFLQTAASVLNTSGEVAGILGSFGSGFIKELKNGTKIASFSWETIRGNYASKFGFEFSQDLNKWRFSPQKLFNGSSHLAQDGWTNVPNWVHNTERISNISGGAEKILNLLNTSITTVHDREFSLQTGLDIVSYKIPAAGDLSKINSFPKYFGGSEFNHQLSW